MAIVKAQDVILAPADSWPPCHLVGDWLNYEKQMNEVSANTLTAYRRGLEVFCSWLADNGLTLAHVRPADVASFKQALAERYSPQTVNLRLTAVRSFYRFAVNTGRAILNPASEVKGAKRSKSKVHKRDALTNGEVLAVLRTCEGDTLEDTRDRAILSLMAYAGARQVEIHRANVGDLRTKDDRLVLYVTGKGRVEPDEILVIPLSQEDVLRAWLALRMKLSFAGIGLDAPLFPSFSNRSYGNRLALRSIRAIVKARFAVAGVTDPAGTKTTHSLRHSAVTNAIRHGATPLQVQAMTRHSSLDTVLNYYHEVGRTDDPAEDLISYEGGNDYE